MEFTYHGMVRYAYGFTNPNHAAALLAILLPLLWYSKIRWRKKRSALFIVSSCEFVLYAGLIMTYSRSGILAVVVGGMTFYLLWRYCCGNLSSHDWLQKGKLILTEYCKLTRCRRGTIFCRSISTGVVKRTSYWSWLQGALLMAAVAGLINLAVISGAGERSIGWLTAPDRSVTNRFAVWQGALRMLADNPYGVGLGNSGTLYTLFYQVPERQTRYRTMVNSFLTFLNEYGIIYWNILCLLILTVVIAGILLLRNRRTAPRIKLQLATWLSGLLIILIVGSCSTCFDLSVIATIGSSDYQEVLNGWLQTGLFFLPLVFVLRLMTVVFRCRKLFKWRTVAVSTVIMLSVMNLLLIAGGRYMNRSDLYRCRIIHSDDNRYVKLSNRKGRIMTVAGFATGEQLPIEKFTVWLKRHYREADLLITVPQLNLEKIAPAVLSNCRHIIICRQDNLLSSPSLKGKLTLFLPQYPPEEKLPNYNKVVLGRYDAYGNNIFWEQIIAKAKLAYYP